jgi:hypothetical protein
MSGNCRVVLRHPVIAKEKLSMKRSNAKILSKNKFMKLQLNNYATKCIYIYVKV